MGRAIRRAAVDEHSGELTLPQVAETSLLAIDGTGKLVDLPPVATLGTIGGTTGAVDNAVLRSDGTSGVGLQGSDVLIDDDNNVSGVVNLAQTGYQDLSEISEPSSPAANVARIYSKNNAGLTKLAWKNQRRRRSPGRIEPWPDRCRTLWPGQRCGPRRSHCIDHFWDSRTDGNRRKLYICRCRQADRRPGRGSRRGDAGHHDRRVHRRDPRHPLRQCIDHAFRRLDHDRLRHGQRFGAPERFGRCSR